MNNNQKLLLLVFIIIFLSNFLNWVAIEIPGHKEILSAFEIFNVSGYWPLVIGFIAPLLGVFFTIKNQSKFNFYSAIACFASAINFYFLILPLGDGARIGSDMKLFHDFLTTGFYLFAISSTLAVYLTANELGLLRIIKANFKRSSTMEVQPETLNDNINSAAQIQVVDNPTSSKGERSPTNQPIKIKLNKTKLILIGIVLMLIAVTYSYFKIYTPFQIKSKVQQVLKKYKFQDSNPSDGFNYVQIVFKDNNLAEIRYIKRTGYYWDDNSGQFKNENCSYKIRIGDNNRIFIDLLSNNGKTEVLEFLQNEQGQTHLNGRYDLYACGGDKNISGDTASINDSKIENADDIIDPTLKDKAKFLLSPVAIAATAVPVDTTAAAAVASIDTTAVVTDTTPKVVDDAVKNINAPNENVNNSTYSVGQYIVNASNDNKVYFYNSPNESTKRKAYISGHEIVDVKSIENGFGYIEFTNTSGQTSVGWLDMKNLIKKPN